METLNLEWAMQLLNSFPSDDPHHTRSHSMNVLKIGMELLPSSGSDALECALLLHDIGHFLINGDREHHAAIGYDYLFAMGVRDPKILLPIAYHEHDQALEQACTQDAMFTAAPLVEQREILRFCRIVHEADILAHMIAFLKYPPCPEPHWNSSLLRKFETDILPNHSEVVNTNDEILYLLCGLSLLRLPESHSMLQHNKIIVRLANLLPGACRSTVLEKATKLAQGKL